MNIKRYIPWQVKIAVKIICSALGITQLVQKIHIFEHGSGEIPEKSLRFFNLHFNPAKNYLDKGFIILELGPGYSVNTAVIAKVYGAKFTYLVDIGNFAKEGFENFKKILDFLKKEDIKESHSVNIKDGGVEYFRKEFNYQYLTNGLDSLKSIPDKSVDFVFSQVVLEHIAKNEFLDNFKELKRITKDKGVHSHTVDLRDHLGSSLNNLRFSERVWQSSLFRKSGFYTNRFLYKQDKV